MSLPILKTTTESTPDALLRYFHQTELQWTRHTSQEAQLDVGVAMHNAETVPQAQLPPNRRIERHHERSRTICGQPTPILGITPGQRLGTTCLLRRESQVRFPRSDGVSPVSGRFPAELCR